MFFAWAVGQDNLVQNPGFEVAVNSIPVGYALQGSARWEYNGYQDEIATYGVSLDSTGAEGSVSQLVKVDPRNGKWVTFSFRGKAEDGFEVKNNELYMRIEFLSKNGTSHLDEITRLIYGEVLADRKNFTVNGDYGKGGAAVWRSYDLEELLPFAETDAIRITVGFASGAGTKKDYSRFLVDDFAVTQRDYSVTGKVDPATVARPSTPGQADEKGLVHLGGRWYYKPAPAESVRGGKVVVTEANADRLFYKDGLFVNPFAGNMTAWLRKGFLDAQGKMVEQDRLVKDNVTITFDGSDTFAVTTHNLPNHPTARFPDTYGTQGYNPNYIMEKIKTYRLPIDPQKNPQAISMTTNDSNMALNMGPVGIAVNGVVFFNPFDAGMQDASNIMDRCCGHPAPDYSYHYHKYPICVNTAFVDKGEGHSPIIGFALDGFPVYGPYESAGVLARDLTENKLNAFNAHYDPVRGWHYHVTPGQFPYLIGGYMGYVGR
ncbi:MAG TPA: YHYH protein [Fimbriimonadaceae bacterium]|nr:YHYH protein [Fimbriimonadaceae bacterium]